MSGHRIDAVSAMKCTPQKTIAAPPAPRRLLAEAERVADVVGHVLDLGHLVVVREDDRVALLGERADLRLHLGDVRGGELTGDGEREGHGAERSKVFASRA